MKRTYTLILIITATIFLGCWGSDESSSLSQTRDVLNAKHSKNILNAKQEPITIDLENSKISEKLKTTDLIDPDHKLVKLETTDDCLIGVISKVIVSKNKIFILDNSISKNLFCFDINGKYLFTVGVKGKGPGEFDVPKDFDVTDDRIFVVDRQSRVFIFDHEGDYKSYIRLPILSTELCVLNNNSLFLYTQDLNEINKSYLIQIDSAKNIRSSDFPLQSKHVSAFSMNQPFSRNGQNILFHKFLSDTIYSISQNTIIPKYFFKHAGKKLEKGIFDDKRLLQDAALKNQGQYSPLATMGLYETSDHLLFRYIKDQNIFVSFFDKKQNRTGSYKLIEDDYFFGGLSNGSPVGITNDYVIFGINTQATLSAYNSVVSQFNSEELKEFKIKYKDFYFVSKESKMDDNPVLLLTKINPAVYEH